MHFNNHQDQQNNLKTKAFLHVNNQYYCTTCTHRLLHLVSVINHNFEPISQLLSRLNFHKPTPRLIPYSPILT